MMKVALLLMMALAPDPATVKVRTDGGGFCSGVCISPDGFVLTAEHCGCASGATIEFPDGQKFSARSEYEPSKNNTDEASLLKITDKLTTILPYHPVAKASPKIGDTILSRGYPQAAYTELRGTVTEIEPSTIHIKGLVPWYGNSGGPLFNENDEVVGICSGYQEDGGRWISWTSIKKAIEQSKVRSDERITVIALVKDDCPPCTTFKIDQTTNRLDVAIKMVEWNEQDYGGYPTPCFWIVRNGAIVADSNGHTVKSGYTGWNELREWVRGTLRLPLSAAEAVEEVVTPKPPAPLPRDAAPKTEPQKYERADASPPAPAAATAQAAVPVVKDEPPLPVDPDQHWNGVTVVVVASTKLPIALRAIEPKVKRAISSASKGMARLEVIAESTNPDQFKEYEDKVGEVDGLEIMILIPKRNLGFATGILIAQIENKIRATLGSKLSGYHIEELFERENPDDYSAIESIAEMADAGRPQADGTNAANIVSLIVGMLGTGLGGMSIGGWIKGFLHRRAAKKIEG